jgi:riboflavin synthase
MFTGIIESTGKVVSVRSFQGGSHLEIDSGLDLKQDHIGDSIAVDGVCLTATHINGSVFTVFASKETITRSTIGSAKKGAEVNIERALTLSSRLGGHMVLGHVDSVSQILQKDKDGESIRIRISLEKAYSKYVIEKGSICVDGISLTINHVGENYFEVNIIPHTAVSTSLTRKNPGDRVNVEFDVIGKYVEKLINKESSTLEDLLKKQGFM